MSDIENIVVGESGDGGPVLIPNIAEVRFAPMVRQGFATENGQGEIVIGVAMMLIGQNSGAVAEGVESKLDDIQRVLPKGVVAFTGMTQASISGNLMSLGAIDFGLIVGGAVVTVENIMRRLSHREAEQTVLETIRDAAQEVVRSTFFAVLIIVLVYFPILTLGGWKVRCSAP